MAFQRETVPQTLSAIIEDDPEPMDRLSPNLPAHLPVIVKRCLAKDSSERYDSTGDLAGDLKALHESLLTTKDRAPVAAKPSRPRRRRKRVARIQSLAVLPLVNLGGDPEQEYFSDGMTEALITDLAKIGALKVISRTSAMSYKGTSKKLPEIAEELNVDAVVEGSVLRAGQRVRITVQLIHARTDQHLWAESYEQDMRDILALQSEVAQAVAREIQIKLTPQEKARLQVARAVDPDVHEAYMKGRYYWSKLTGEGLEKGLEQFNKAIERDPTYAPAHAGLADIYNVLSLFTASAPKEVFPKAKAAAMRALELDETLPEAHIALAWVKMLYDWDWLGAEREYTRAIELNPGSSYAHSWHSALLTMTERKDEAIAEAKRAQELDPLSIQARWIMGWVFAFTRFYDEATEKMQEVIKMDPDFLFGHYVLGHVYAAIGRYEEAIESYRKASTGPGESDPRARACVGVGCALAGLDDEARKILAECMELSTKKYVSPVAIAGIHTCLGDKEKAFHWLEKAYEMRDGDLSMLKVFPLLDPLRSDPRFKDLLRRLNFPE